MDKSCANHPESMALATCKACEKSVCLMCVVDEKEGTFCSADCHTAFANGQEVPKFVGAATESGSSGGGGVQKLDSIFDDEPAAAPSTALSTPPDAEPMPIVSEGTKWRPIGAQCDNHADTPAVANCDRCGKPVCALCLLEASQGTFCSSECMNGAAAAASEASIPAEQPRTARKLASTSSPAATYSAPAERAALQGKPVFKFKEPPKSNKSLIAVAAVVFLVAGAAGAHYGWNAFTPDSLPEPPTKPPDFTNVPVNPDPTPVKPDPVPDPTPVKPDPTPVKPDPTPVKPDPTPRPYVPPLPKVKLPPKPVAIPSRALNPWSESDPGVWYRVRSSKDGKVTFTDVGLKEKGKDFVVLATQTSADGQASAVTEAKTAPTVVYLRGEEKFTFEGTEYLCEIQTATTDESAPKTWSLLSGKNMGAVLKTDSLKATKVWEHNWRVKNIALDCLVVEGQVAGKSVKSWYCGAIPLGLVRQEKDGESMALVDMGKDWSKRPAFPAK